MGITFWTFVIVYGVSVHISLPSPSFADVAKPIELGIDMHAARQANRSSYPKLLCRIATNSRIITAKNAIVPNTAAQMMSTWPSFRRGRSHMVSVAFIVTKARQLRAVSWCGRSASMLGLPSHSFTVHVCKTQLWMCSLVKLVPHVQSFLAKVHCVWALDREL